MPKINRIRIANFSYNNNRRHIVDETFDFYGGENALLSLANGGGKSVLVQTVLQPIVPKTKLLGRRFSDFFIGKRDPAYIMIEWLLDEGAGFFLTGISISPSNSYKTNSDEDNLTLRFYTFCHHYEEGNKYDIKHLPVTEDKKNGIVVTGYNDMKKLLRKEEGKGEYAICCYNSSKEEQTAYERKLNAFSISRNEWKELIVNINQAEQGVSEVFAKCKSSRAVMEQWVIKYIEKVLDKSSEGKISDHQKLEEMMMLVATEEVENENFIQEYEAIRSFRSDLNDIDEGAKNICTLLDSENGKKKELAAMFSFFADKMGEIKENEKRVENEISRKEAEIKHIGLEKKSWEIHLIEDETEKLTKKLEAAKRQSKEVAEKAENIRKELNLQHGAREYVVLKEKEQEKAGQEQKFENAAKDEEELQKEMNRIEYSLKCLYSNKIRDLKEDMRDSEHNLRQLTAKRKDMSNQLKSKHDEKNRLNSDKGGLEEKVNGFCGYEKKVCADLGIHLNRNPLLNELDQGEVEKVRNGLKQKLSDFENSYSNAEEAIENSKGEKQSEKENLLALGERLSDAKEELAIKGNLISQYQEEKAEIQSIISTYCNKQFSVFEQEAILDRLRKQYDEWSQKAIISEMEINELSKMINGLKEGISYLPAMLVKILKDNDLEIYTGEQYLRGLPPPDREKIMSNNPLLPYGIIVTDKEHQIIAELIEETDINQLVPVFSHSNKEALVELGGNRMLSNPVLLRHDQGALISYIETKEKQKEELAGEKKAAAETAEGYVRAISAVIKFKWTEAKEKELYLRSEEIAGEVEKIAAEQEGCSNRIDHLAKAVEDLKEGLHGIEKDIKKIRSNIELLEEFIEKNVEYVANLCALNQIMTRIETLDGETEKTNNVLESLGKEIEGIKNGRLLEEKDLEDFIGKYGKYKDAVEDVLIEGTEAELEERQKACKAKGSDALEDIRQRLISIQKDIDRVNENIKRLGLNVADVINLRHSEIVEDELRESIDKLENEKKEHDGNINKTNGDILKLDGRKREIIKNLNGHAILSRSDIKGNFEERKKKLNQSIELLSAQLETLKSQYLLLSNLNTRIDAKVENISQIEFDSKALIEIDGNTETIVNELIEKLLKATKEASGAIIGFKNNFDGVRNSYSGSISVTVREAIKGIYVQIDNLSRSYSKYFYLTERIAFYNEQLEKTMRLMQTKINQLKHSKNDLIEHAYLEAKNIYDEIPKVVDNSSIEIDGARKRILDIKYDKIQSDEVAKERIKDHVLTCLDNITHDIKNDEDESRIRKNIIKILSTKELLNVISNLEKFKVKAYKVDINEKNRRMMSWEELIVKNSGGEKFVAYFSLLVALISYSRKNTRFVDIFKKKEESKVLIMDNPFGPITSGHLLKPMFDIAKKYDTQLICLSDIKEGAVINSFNLVYNLKIRQNMMKEEYLDVEENNFDGLKTDERLEKAFLYSKATQMSLLSE